MSMEAQRILKTIEYYYSDGEVHSRCPVCGINPVQLDEELNKIREQEKKKAYKAIIKNLEDFKGLRAESFIEVIKETYLT